MCPKNLQKVMGISFFAAVTRRVRKIQPNVDCVKTRETGIQPSWPTGTTGTTYAIVCMSRMTACSWTKESSFRSNSDKRSLTAYTSHIQVQQRYWTCVKISGCQYSMEDCPNGPKLCRTGKNLKPALYDEK